MLKQMNWERDQKSIPVCQRREHGCELETLGSWGFPDLFLHRWTADAWKPLDFNLLQQVGGFHFPFFPSFFYLITSLAA